MPNTTSAKKALRQSKTRYARNTAKKKALREAVKKYKKAVEAGTAPQEHLSVVYKKLDKAAKTNLITKNKASRLKSRLTRYGSKKTAAAKS